MISSIIESGTYLSIRDSSGREIGSAGMANTAFLLGHSSTHLVVQNGDMIISIDENGRTLGSVIHYGDYRVGGITDNGFYVKTGSLTTQYDKYCNIVNKY